LKTARGIASLLTVALICAACGAHVEDVRESRFIMGTLVTFTVAGAPHDQALDAIRAAAREMQRIEDEFTIYGAHANAVKAFNDSKPGKAVALPGEVSQLLIQSMKISKESHNAFTPLIGALSLLWGFSLPEAPTAPPSRGAIHIALTGVRDALIRHTGNHWQRLSPQTKLDFGAIAKGYAIDRGIAVLKAHGVKSAILDAGGDLRAIGSHNGKPWRIGIKHPRQAGKTLGWFEVHGDISIVTSGDYERFFMYNGKRYHHIMNPDTGMPAMKTMSATIVAPNATVADGWSTALFVQGPAGLKQVEAHGFQAILMDEAGKLHTTPSTLVPFHPALAEETDRRLPEQ